MKVSVTFEASESPTCSSTTEAAGLDLFGEVLARVGDRLLSTAMFNFLSILNELDDWSRRCMHPFQVLIAFSSSFLYIFACHCSRLTGASMCESGIPYEAIKHRLPTSTKLASKQVFQISFLHDLLLAIAKPSKVGIELMWRTLWSAFQTAPACDTNLPRI
jgi:hypothetical protein